MINDLCDLTKRSWRYHINSAILSILNTELNYLDISTFISILNRYISVEFDNLNRSDIRWECGIIPNVRYETCLVPSNKNKKYHNFKVFIGDTIIVYLLGNTTKQGVVTYFKEDSIGFKDGCGVPLCDIKDISVLSRADSNSDWK